MTVRAQARWQALVPIDVSRRGAKEALPPKGLSAGDARRRSEGGRLVDESSLPDDGDAGDLEAVERIYRRHRDRVHRLARLMLATDDVDDALQDIFVRV